MKIFSIVLCFFITFSIVFPFTLTAQNIYTFHPDSSQNRIEILGLLKDCDVGFTFKEVSSPPFQDKFEWKDSLVYEKGCKHWLQLKVYIPDSLEGLYLLEQPFNKQTTHYYYPNSVGNYEHVKSGTGAKPSERNFNFPRYSQAIIYLVGGDTSTLYVMFDSPATRSGVTPRLYLEPYSNKKRKKQELEYHVLLMLIAILVLLTIYNAILFFYTKDKSYLYYALTFLAFTGVISNIQEYFWMWLPNTGTILESLMDSSVGIGFTFFCLFSLQYLGGQSVLPNQRKWVVRVAYIFSFFSLIFGPIQATFDIQIVIIAAAIANIGIIVCIIAFLLYAYLLLRKGQVTAQYYIYASLVMLPFIFLYYAQGSDLTHHGFLSLIPSSTLTRMSLPIGIVMQALAFSLALGARINVMRKEIATQEVEKERLEREKLLEVQQLIEKQKAELEVTVRKRTQSLQEANEELRLSEERLEELNKTKDHFFALIAHDLRGPVASFQGISQTLQYQIKKNNIEKVNSMMVQMDKSSTHLNILLDNLLQWAQSQMGGMNFNPQRVSLHSLAVEVQEIYEGMEQAKEIQTFIDITPLKLSLWVDEPSVATILRNLWSNAFKYTENGTVTLKAVQKENMTHISIIDTGKGMSPENLEKIFEIDHSKIEKGTQGEKGNGLGLLLCQEFATKNGGKIWIESEAGKGTSVHLLLPTFSPNKA